MSKAIKGKQPRMNKCIHQRIKDLSLGWWLTIKTHALQAKEVHVAMAVVSVVALCMGLTGLFTCHYRTPCYGHLKKL